jgi:pimeloyl-ACP methyl ester carboxylesterase
MWRFALPALMERYYVVAVDLRGYGDSAKPDGEEGYDKGTMAADLAALIAELGLDRPLLFGHDRGARVARRYALDHPDALRGLALLDILPVEYVYDRLSAAEVSERYWHWVFHLVPELPEALIAGHEEAYLERFFSRTPGLLERMQADGAWLEYRRCWLQPGAIAAALNDYRATFRQDVPRYRAEAQAGRRLTVPTLVLWGNRGNLSNQPVLDIWRQVAMDVRGQLIPRCGHYLPEEQPEIVTGALLQFAEECFGAAE